MLKVEPKPLKYKPPEHAIQFIPDYSMLSLSKPKRRRKRKGDDSFVWLGDVGTTSFRKRSKHKKRKKKVGVIITVFFIPGQSPFIFFKFNLLKVAP